MNYNQTTALSQDTTNYKQLHSPRTRSHRKEAAMKATRIEEGLQKSSSHESHKD
jgi:hypothetical protein